ncbi:hypothetical protein ABE042_12540 [Viridibacillus arvi]
MKLIIEIDWVTDMSPEGGSSGSKFVANGTPVKVAAGYMIIMKT